MTNKTSFGKYFDDQRDRIVKNMQNKNKQQNVEWMEAYEKREQLKDYNHRRSIKMPVDSTTIKEATYVDEDTKLFWWESIGT